MLLSELGLNESGFILSNTNEKDAKRKLEELGFVQGTKVTLIKKSPFEDFLIFEILDCQVAINKKEAGKISINKTVPSCICCNESSYCKSIYYKKPKRGKKISIAIIGNPGSGKTSFFNLCTGSHKYSEGHSHSDIENKVGFINNFQGYQIKILEYPGLYSLPHSTTLSDENLFDEDIDVIVNVVNVNALERNLLLTTDVLSLGKPVIVALNMFDEFENNENFIDVEKLSEQLHCKVFKTAFKHNRGTKELLENIITTYETQNEGIGFNFENIAVEEKMNFIKHILTLCDYKKSGKVKKNSIYKIFDAIVTNKFSCYLFFALVMFLFFKITFEVGEYGMDFINPLMDFLSLQINKIPINATLQSLIIDGIFPAVCTLLAFLPQIVILFFFLSLIENSGYMSRIILIMDSFMNKFGLHGKSFISIITGFGCNVPAIMATRNIENKKARLITILTISLISCSGLIPTYTYIINYAFDDKYKFLILCGIYGLTIVLLFAISSLLNFFLKGDNKNNFVIDLQPYRLPSLGLILKNSFHKSIDFFKGIMTTVTFMSCIVWSLSYFPNKKDVPFQEKISSSYIAKIGKSMEPIFKVQNFDWKMNSSLLVGISHKELIVSSLSVLNKRDEKIQPQVALPFLIFISLYCPCIATLIVIARELTWYWALFTFLYTTGIAWIFSALTAWGISLFC